MNISTLNNLSAYPVTTNYKTPVSKVKPVRALNRDLDEPVVYEKDSTESKTKEAFDNITYENPIAKHKTMEKLMRESEAKAKERTECLRELARRIFVKQYEFHSNEDLTSNSSEKVSLQKHTNKPVDIIKETNYWTVEETSSRLYDFAIALFEGDTTKVDTMNITIEAGYELAKNACSEEFPEVCKKTLYSTINKLMSFAYRNEEISDKDVNST